MKIESRGKYAGVKVHLDADECQHLIKAVEDKIKALDAPVQCQVPLSLAIGMGQKIKGLLAEEPTLLQDRTPEQIAAILAKESEKAAMQLNAIKSGKQWQKVNPEKLQAALLKHVK